MNFFQNLGTRERLFVLGAAVAILLTLLFTLVIDPLMTQAARLDRQIVAAQHQYQKLQASQRDYQEKKRVLDNIIDRIKNQKNFSIISQLEGLAGKNNLRNKILYMKPTAGVQSDAYREESVEIKMEGVTLDQLIRYLQQVESSAQFMKIKRLYIKPRFDNRQILTAIFRVSTFMLKEGTS